MASMVRDYKNALGSFNKNARLMLAYYAVCAVANGMVTVLLNLYYLKLGLDETFLGSLVFVQSLVFALLVLPFGMIADRFPKHTMVKVGWVLMNPVFIGLMVFKDPKTLIMLQVIQSFGAAVSIGAEFPYLCENVAPSARTHLFSMNMAVFTAGPAIGMAVAGYLPKVLGHLLSVDPDSAVAYRLGLLVAAALYLLTGVFVAGLSAGSPSMDTQTKRLSLRFSRPAPVIGICLNSALVGLAISLFGPFMNVIMNRRFAMEPYVIGWVFTAQNVAISLGSLLVPKLGEKRGKLEGAATLQLLALPAYLMLALAPNAGLFVAAYIVRAVLANMAGPLLDSYVVEVTRSGERGTVNAALNLARNLMWAVGGKMGGAFLQRNLFTTPVLLASGTYAVAVSVIVTMLRVPQMRDTCVPFDAERTGGAVSDPK